MTTPTFKDYRSTGHSANGLYHNTIRERILVCLAVLASGQNPDGTTSPT